MTGLSALAVLVAVVAWLGLRNGSDQADLAGPDETTSRQGEREERLTTMLDDLSAGLGKGTTAPLATAGGAAQLKAIDDNVRRIGFSDLALRYVAPAEQAEDQLSGEDTWVADVQVTWQFDGYDVAPSTLEVPMVVTDDGERARFVGFDTPAGSDRIPLWLLERLAVDKTDRTLVLAADRSRLADLSMLAERAVPAVNKVLPDWQGALVLAEPSSADRLNTALGADATSTAQLAGVTTTVDGSVARGGTSHILLNPDVFGRLGPQAAQIVVTHEATHLATDAATSSMPQWLVEGFADYVALRDSGIPVSVSASQILGQVRREGSPTKLPASSEFGGENARIGAAYESAWLACRLIAQEYGEQGLVDFYHAADATGDTTAAFRSVLGVSEAGFTREWRNHLADLASSS